MLERLLSDISPEVARMLDGALSGNELSADDAVALLHCQGPDLQALARAADVARSEDNGDDVSFVVNRNINFTNVCYVGCSFCGFSRHKEDTDVYDHEMDVLVEKARNAVERGATEVCIQGGIADVGFEEAGLGQMARVHGQPLDQPLACSFGAFAQLAQRRPGRLGIDEVDRDRRDAAPVVEPRAQ